MKKIKITNKNNHGDKITATAIVMDGKEELFTYQLSVRSKGEMDNTCRNILALADQVEADFQEIEEGDWEAPAQPTPQPQPEPSEEEKELHAIAAAEQELAEAYEKAKREKEIKELAATNPELDAKLKAVAALKAKKINVTPSKGGGKAI